MTLWREEKRFAPIRTKFTTQELKAGKIFRLKKLYSVHPEMVDIDFRQGPNEFSTAPKTSRDLRQA